MTKLRNFKEWANHNSYVIKRQNVMENAEPHTETPVVDMTPIAISEWTVNDWRKVNGIGPTLAMRLSQNGPYNTIEDIRRVKGISEKIVENLKCIISTE